MSAPSPNFRVLPHLLSLSIVFLFGWKLVGSVILGYHAFTKKLSWMWGIYALWMTLVLFGPLTLGVSLFLIAFFDLVVYGSSTIIIFDMAKQLLSTTLLVWNQTQGDMTLGKRIYLNYRNKKERVWCLLRRLKKGISKIRTSQIYYFLQSCLLVLDALFLRGFLFLNSLLDRFSIYRKLKETWSRPLIHPPKPPNLPPQLAQMSQMLSQVGQLQRQMQAGMQAPPRFAERNEIRDRLRKKLEERKKVQAEQPPVELGSLLKTEEEGSEGEISFDLEPEEQPKHTSPKPKKRSRKRKSKKP